MTVQATEAVWSGPPERLDRVVAELGLARSRSRATEFVVAQQVQVNGRIAAKAGIKVASGSRIAIMVSDPYVGRAAGKLVAGLDAFGIDPEGRLALDLGASTGGFTQVLLERGARAVQAIDVGHGQMAPELAADPRVRLVEGCNARDLEPAALADLTGEAAPASLVVADLSFISLTLILPAIARCAAPDADLVLLIKPQFEVGRVKDGVVTSSAQRAEAMRIVLAAAYGHGYACQGVVDSPVIGGMGNREYLVHFARAGSPDPTQWEEQITVLSELAE